MVLHDRPLLGQHPWNLMTRLKLTSMLGVAAALLAPLVVPVPAGAQTAYSPQITNSQDASPGEYPYMVSLQADGFGHFCGGSVIDPEWVLTAAHCIDGGDIEVYIGSVDLEGDGERIAVTEQIVHPDYVDVSQGDDVALLRLATPTDAPPITLVDNSTVGLEDAGTEVVLTGWGYSTADRSESPTILQEASMPVIGDAECTQMLDDWDGSGAAYDAVSMMCAGEPNTADGDMGTDACQGDSGGPLVGTEGGERIQVGIVSWGPTCGQTPSAYTRVSTYLGFIAESMGVPVDPGPDDGVLDNTTRLAGTTRYATAADLATDRFAPGGAVFVVTGLSYPDALAAAPAAAGVGAPVLLTTRDSLPDETADALTQLEPSTIFVVGGTGAVSDAVLAQLGGFASGDTVRIAGVNRYETAALLSSIAFSDGLGGGLPVFLASGETFADALSAAATAAAEPVPLLLTSRGSLPQETIAELDRLQPSSVVIFGGIGAVSADVESQLVGLGWDTDRIAGATRYDTSADIVERFFSGTELEVIAATGTNFPDGLVAGALGLPLILVPQGEIPATTSAAIESVSSDSLLVLGGTGAISDAQALDLDELVGG
jgi:secreted trypsin-like serine protease